MQRKFSGDPWLAKDGGTEMSEHLVRERQPVLHFFMKSARLSELDAPFCWPASRACSPAFRFLARFLLLALADGFLEASVLVSVFIGVDAADCDWLLDLLILAFAAGTVGSRLMRVDLWQRPQRMTLRDPLRGFWGWGSFPFPFSVRRRSLRVSTLRLSSPSARRICPQAPHASCLWTSDGRKPWRYSSSCRWLIRWAEVAGAVAWRR